MNNIEEGKYLITDLISGDNSIDNNKLYKELSDNDISKALQLILTNPNLSEQKKLYYINNIWKINFTQKPPTPEEFLTYDWIGASSLNLYSHVKETIIKFLNQNNKYKNIYLSSCIGWGKSTLSAIIILYILTHINLMKNPKKFFNVMETSAIVAALGSFTLSKTRQVLLKPFLNILKSSPKFRMVRTEDRIFTAQQEEKLSGSNKIVWSRASTMDSDIQLSNDLHIICVSDSTSMLGLNIICGALSELSFFVKKGISLEEVTNMISELQGRIFNRFSTNYYAKFIIDSSPLSFDSPIDKYVFSGEAEKDPDNFVIKAKHWELEDFKQKYPEWRETKKTFSIFLGSASKPTKLIENNNEKINYNPQDILDLPIDLYKHYIKNPTKIVRDFVGYPTNSEDKLIDNFNIIENMFNDQLKNIIDGIYVPATSPPEKLIWNQIYKNFFIKISDNNYEFYRAASEERFIHIDQSESKDMTSITMVHPEINLKGELIIVVDFTIAIIPDKNRINLDAISEFIFDLKKVGKIYIKKVTFDKYQSSSTIQRFDRAQIETGLFSVDASTAPYYSVISWLKNNRIKSGKNIFLKNNLKSIYELKKENGNKKIEHTIGKLEYVYNNNWETSIAGINSKDISDSWCGACYHCINDWANRIPKFQFIEDVNKNDKEVLKKDIIKKINEKYNYVLNK